MTDLRSIRERINALGFGDRRTRRSETTGRHEIYRLDTGEPIDNMTAHEAAEWLESIGG